MVSGVSNAPLLCQEFVALYSLMMMDLQEVLDVTKGRGSGLAQTWRSSQAVY